MWFGTIKCHSFLIVNVSTEVCWFIIALYDDVTIMVLPCIDFLIVLARDMVVRAFRCCYIWMLQNFRILVTSTNYLFILFKALQLDYLSSFMVLEACPWFLLMVVMQSSWLPFSLMSFSSILHHLWLSQHVYFLNCRSSFQL